MLGVQLVERNTRHVVMTDVGLAVVKQARKVLQDVQVIKEIASSFEDPMAGDLQLGLIPTIAPYLLPQIMPVMKQHFPKLKLWLHEYQTDILLDKLQNGQLDILIQALPIAPHSFVEHELFSEPFWLATHKDHPLAKQQEVSLAQLAGQEMLLLQEGHCLREHALDVCLLAGAMEDQRFFATSLETLRHMVGEGMGITLLPEMAVPKKPDENSSICYRPFTLPAPVRRIGLLYRKGSYRETSFMQIAEVISQVMEKH